MTTGLRLSANLGFLWTDLPLLARIRAAAMLGFQAVEMHWPFDVPANEVAQVCQAQAVRLLSVNTPQGNVAQGDLGLAAQPGRTAEFQKAFEDTLAWAQTAGASMIHVLPGRSSHSPHARDCFIENLQWASDLARTTGIILLLEAMNRRDRPDYFYSTQDQADEIRVACGRDNIKLLFDVYHAGIEQGDVLALLRQKLPHIGHIQIAGVPARNEPDQGQVRYEAVFAQLVRLGYSGWIGCEYRPDGDLAAGLRRWTRACGVSLG